MLDSDWNCILYHSTKDLVALIDIDTRGYGSFCVDSLLSSVMNNVTEFLELFTYPNFIVLYNNRFNKLIHGLQNIHFLNLIQDSLIFYFSDM